MREGLTKYLVILGSLLLLAGCNSSSYDGDVGSSGSPNAGGDVVINELGRTQYNEQCGGCHGFDGGGGTSNKPMVGCAQCGSLDGLISNIEHTMPPGAEDLCVGDCAKNTAEYIMAAFNNRSVGNVRSEISGVENLDAKSTLRKAALNLTGRLPTKEEQAFVESKGEEGLDEALASVVEDPGFYDRLKEIYNEILLTDKYITFNDERGGLQLLDNDDFPNRYWFESEGTTVAEDNRRCYRAVANDAVAREPLELVANLAKNNESIQGVVNADYIMVNWYSLQVFGAELVSGQNPNEAFATATAQVQQDVKDKYWQCRGNGRETNVPYDPNDFKKARITHSTEYSSSGTPHSGVLTSPMFLNRFPTTATNRNRARAKTVFDYFLDTDILSIEGARPDDAIDDTGSSNPTLENQACYSCHHIMDPVASAFQHWTDTGRYIQSTAEGNANSWSSDGIQPPGLGGKKAPISGASSVFSKLLPWLGNEIANDPRYRRAVVRTLYRGIIGTDTVTTNSTSTDAEKAVYDAQRGILDQIANEMVANNWNIKTAVIGIVKSPFFRANKVEETASVVVADTGSVRLLSPDQLQRKLKTTVGKEWGDLNDQNNQLLFGGMDSDDVTERMKDPNGIMVAMQKRMSIEVACDVTAEDFVRARTPQTNSRLLFPYVSLDTVPQDRDGWEIASNVSAIKQNIQYLHWRLLGEELTVNSAEVNATYELFLTIWLEGNKLIAEDMLDDATHEPDPNQWLNWRCGANTHPDTNEELTADKEIYFDGNYVIRAWSAVLTYLLSDYRFIYE